MRNCWKYIPILRISALINDNIGKCFQILEKNLTSDLDFSIFITTTEPKLNVMKPKLRLIVINILVFGLFFSTFSYAQNLDANIRYQNEFWKMWSVNINAGATSFYGDLSSFDNNYFEKLVNESGPAIGIQINRHIDRIFSFSGQLLIGKMTGSASSSSFNANILEYNLHLRINLLGLVFPKNSTKYGLNAFAGVGNFIFNSEKQVYREENIDYYEHTTRVPEFVYFFGGGFYYNLNVNFGITADLSIRRCQNDKLDVEYKNGDFDYYSYLGVGIIYYLQGFKKAPVKNKARIAHNNNRLKPLH